MQILALTLALFAGCATAAPPAEQISPSKPDAAGAPIERYLEESAKKVELERILDRYSSSGDDSTAKSVVNELRPVFDAAYKAAEGSEGAQGALDEHWLLVSRCLNVGGESRFEKSRQHSDCKGDLASAEAKVELMWSRHKPE